MAEMVASLPSAGFGAVAAIAIRAIVQAFKINKDADGALDKIQASRITELEKRMDENDRDCHAKLDAVNAKLVILAQVNIHVTAELKIHAPESPTLEWAKLALQRAFPVNFDTPPDMVAKARKLGDGG
jgi:hypothetical protein